MIRVNNASAKAMEFTSFRKNENTTDDDLMKAVLEFETEFLAKQEGVIFHCLVRNFDDEYANVLFAKDKESLHALEKAAHNDAYAGKFFGMLDMASGQMSFHDIGKDNFTVPEHFSCVEFGSFSLKGNNNFQDLRRVSDKIEENYLSQFDNTQAHFIGQLGDNVYSEVTMGKTLGNTKEICMGYIGNPVCQPMLEMADEKSMKLEFWYVIA